MKHVFTKQWFEATLIRMIRTFAESCLVVIGTGTMFVGQVNWLAVLSGGAMGAIICFLLALKGLPEVGEENAYIEEK